jgi:hypothetical protein
MIRALGPSQSELRDPWTVGILDLQAQRRIEIELSAACIKYYYLSLSRKTRSYFPELGKPFTIQSNIGPLTCHVISKGYKINSAEGRSELSRWFKHNSPKAGDMITLEVNEHAGTYRLEGPTAVSQT